MDLKALLKNPRQWYDHLSLSNQALVRAALMRWDVPAIRKLLAQTLGEDIGETFRKKLDHSIRVHPLIRGQPAQLNIAQLESGKVTHFVH